MAFEEVQHVTPDVSSLSSITVNISCPEGCSRTFANSSALRLHLRQVHHKEDECATATTSDVWYHCPETACSYHVSFGSNGKHFSKLKYLKQHYLKVHAVRDHLCECGRAFSTVAHLAQHRRGCGIDLMCTCGCSFQAMETLQTHVRRFDHAIMTSTLQALRARKSLLAESVRAANSLAKSTAQAVIAHSIPIKCQGINDRKEETASSSSSFPPTIAPTPAAICSTAATFNHVTPVHFRQPTHMLAAIALSELAATSMKRLPCADVGIQTEPEHGRRSRRKSLSPAKCSEYFEHSTNNCSFSKRKRTAETQTRLTHRDSKQIRSGSSCATSPLNTPVNSNSNDSITGNNYMEECTNENGSLSGLSLQVDLPEFITTHHSTSGTQTSPRVGRLSQPSLHDFTISFFDRACGEDEPQISPSLTTITSTQTSDLDSYESSQLLIEEDEELLVVGDSAVVGRQRPPSLGHIRSSSIETQTDHDVLLSKNADNTPDDVDGIILTNTETQTDPSNLLNPDVNHSYPNSGDSGGCHIHEGDSLWCTSETQTYEDFSDIEQFMRSTIHTQTPDNSHSELFPELSFTHTQTQTSLDDPPSLVTTHTQTPLSEL